MFNFWFRSLYSENSKTETCQIIQKGLSCVPQIAGMFLRACVMRELAAARFPALHFPAQCQAVWTATTPHPKLFWLLSINANIPITCFDSALKHHIVHLAYFEVRPGKSASFSFTFKPVDSFLRSCRVLKVFYLVSVPAVVTRLSSQHLIRRKRRGRNSMPNLPSNSPLKSTSFTRITSIARAFTKIWIIYQRHTNVTTFALRVSEA